MSPWRGVFGKMPATGDFVSRGLPSSVRRALDLSLTRDIGRRDGNWPEGGLRGLIGFEGGLALFLAVPSRDAVGRRFPLVVAVDGRGLSFEAAEAWCDAALPALSDAAAGTGDLETVLAALDGLLNLPRYAEDGEPVYWTAARPPGEASAETLDDIFSSD